METTQATERAAHGRGRFRGAPRAERRDLPDAPPLRRLVGPSVILIGVGIASGEYILYPYIASRAGLTFLWAAVVGILVQYFINMEIERYTLATGETALGGFQRMWKGWGIVLGAGAILATMWPGWATAAATVTTFAVGGGDPNAIAIAMLLVIGAALTASPVVYQTVERLEFIKVAIVLVFVVVAVFAGISGTAYRRHDPGRHELRHVPGRDRPRDPGGRAGGRGRGRREQPRAEQLDPRQGLRHGPLRSAHRLPDHRRGGGRADRRPLRRSRSTRRT